METNTKELIENFIARGGFEISEKFCYEDNDSMVDLWRIQSALKISLIEPNKNSIENLAFWSEYSQIDYPKSVIFLDQKIFLDEDILELKVLTSERICYIPIKISELPTFINLLK